MAFLVFHSFVFETINCITMEKDVKNTFITSELDIICQSIVSTQRIEFVSTRVPENLTMSVPMYFESQYSTFDIVVSIVMLVSWKIIQL